MHPVVLHYAWWERLVCFLLALSTPLLVIVGFATSVDRPPTMKLVELGVFAALFALLWIVSIRFEVRLDEKEVFHREIVTRRIPLAQIRQIRVARSSTGFPFYVKRVSVEILGGDSRILVAWREAKLRPLLTVLEDRFRDRLETVKALPDA